VGSWRGAVRVVGWLLPLALLSVEQADAHSRATASAGAGARTLADDPFHLRSSDGGAVATSTRLSFGNYDESSPWPNDAEAQLWMSCSKGAGVSIALGQGVHAAPGSTYALPLRQMSNGGTGLLGYNLYRDPERTVVWGSSAATGVHVACNGDPQPLRIYGRAPAGQPVQAGKYGDSLLATVIY
jgi:spore coat protein U-like protein